MGFHFQENKNKANLIPSSKFYLYAVVWGLENHFKKRESIFKIYVSYQKKEKVL